MSYSIIHQLLDNGLTEEELIASLAKSLPHVANKARKMFMGGWSPKQMLNEFSKDKKVQQSARNLKPVTPSEIAALHLMNSQTNIPQGASEKSQEELTNFTKMAAPVALGTLAAPMAEAALSRALPKVPGMLRTALGRQAINAGTSQLPQAGSIQEPSQNSQGMQSVVPSSTPGSVSDSIPQPTNAVQQNINPEEYLQKHGILDRVKSLLKAGNTPEGVAAAMGVKRTGGTNIDPELLANIDAYAKKSITDEAMQPEGSITGKILGQEKKSPEMAEIGQKQPKNGRNVAVMQALPGESAAAVQKRLKIGYGEAAKLVEERDAKSQPTSIGNMVATPHGVGEVLAERNGQSIVEVDGKKHKVEEKNLLKPPKEAAIEALELIKGFTPEKMRSTHHMLNAYDEGEKKGFFVFHNGTAYVVDDVSPEEYKELSEEIEEAKTTGETIIGKWAAGEGSRGAAYNKHVKGVRERKVVPELKKKFRKLKVGYNLLAEWQRLLNEK